MSDLRAEAARKPIDERWEDVLSAYEGGEKAIPSPCIERQLYDSNPNANPNPDPNPNPMVRLREELRHLVEAGERCLIDLIRTHLTPKPCNQPLPVERHASRKPSNLLTHHPPPVKANSTRGQN